MTSQPDSRTVTAERSANKAVILLYHRVTELPTDPQLLCVSPSRFAEHLEILRKRFKMMSLLQLVRAMDGGDIPSRSVVVTFDDGYADNLYNAKPLFDCHGIPATVFVVSGLLGSNKEFWWDELDRLLLQPGTLPKTLRMTLADVPHEWHLGDAAVYDAALFHRFRPWNVLERADPTPRHQAYRELCTLLCPLSSPLRRQALDDLSRWAGQEVGGRPTHQTLTAAELRQLAHGGLIEIGAHTVTHPVLSRCSHSPLRAVPHTFEPVQSPGEGSALPGSHPVEDPYSLMKTAPAEIREGKSDLEAVLGCPVMSFSYPYGQRHDYTPETVDLVRHSGFACACSAFSGFVRPDSDRFQLPRMIVRDWDGEIFASHLERWWSDG
jgi:peptidoglycan/xylan/chitin deacetylase (PgdA/CDA1 family)